MSTVDSAAVFMALQQTMEEERRKQIEAIERPKKEEKPKVHTQEVESVSSAMVATYAATQILKTSSGSR